MWLFRRLFRRKILVPMSVEDLFARHHATDAGDKSHEWKCLPDEPDQQLVVIGPRRGIAADDLRNLGQALASWKSTCPQARQIWGLAELLEGRRPSTPSLLLPVPCEPGGSDPVVLVYVAKGTGLEPAARELFQHLRAFHGKLAYFEHPLTYGMYNR